LNSCHPRNPRLAFDFFQLLKKHRILGLVADRVNVDVTDDSLLINDENGALGKAFCPKDTILQGGQSMRPEITQQGIRNVAKRLRPCLNRRQCVNTEAQDLGVIPRELGEVLLVSRYLNGSDGGESQGVKRHDDVLFAPEVRELNL